MHIDKVQNTCPDHGLGSVLTLIHILCFGQQVSGWSRSVPSPPLLSDRSVYRIWRSRSCSSQHLSISGHSGEVLKLLISQWRSLPDDPRGQLDLAI